MYWQNLGEGLAELHRESHTQFGFEGDNFCGASPQRNPRLDDGFEFFANYRLLGPAKAAHERGLLEDRDRDDLEFIANRLDAWIPKQEPYSFMATYGRGISTAMAMASPHSSIQQAIGAGPKQSWP